MKKSILTNYKFVLLKESTKHFQFIKDETELKRLTGDGTIKDGDSIIELTEENLKVATLQNFIEIQ